MVRCFGILALSVLCVTRFATAADASPTMQRARERVFPALVFVKVIQQTHDRGERSAREGAGSGVLISEDGEFLTNWHVVEKAESVRCLLTDGRAFVAEVIGSDKDTDLALCRLALPEGETVPFATLGDSDALVEGDPVFVMGAPWGLSRSISSGIISCTRRYLEEASEYTLWLQTDAAISPGNSGGPVVNQSGEVVGITARGALIGGNLGFAIPSRDAAMVSGRLRTYQSMNWSWTGLQLQPLRDFDKNMYFDFSDGVIVSATDAGSPARKAGIQPKDRLVSINGVAVTALTQEDIPAINCRLGLLEKEQPSAFTFVRNDETIEVSMVPREKGQVEGDEQELPRWDFSVKAINQFDTPNLYFYREKGVFVFAVKYPGNAQNSTLQTNDIIVKAGDRDIESMDDLLAAHKEALENVAQNHRIMLTVLRKGQTRMVSLDFSRDYKRR
ncbi:MAG: trypsin-like peptidase domain-containing protein [Kiritimatiellaeota bacterium]|nr:trypsin-like peptidase domain-containing protein [Kiritimatiellota bacterium]